MQVDLNDNEDYERIVIGGSDLEEEDAPDISSQRRPHTTPPINSTTILSFVSPRQQQQREQQQQQQQSQAEQWKQKSEKTVVLPSSPDDRSISSLGSTTTMHGGPESIFNEKNVDFFLNPVATQLEASDFSFTSEDYLLNVPTSESQQQQQQQHQQQQDNTKAMNSLIASELNQLGPEGRVLAYEDIHCCVASKPKENDPEDPTDMKNLTSLVDTLVKEVKRFRDRSAFDKAIFLAPKYVTNPEFCLMFLRAERFNIRRSAKRLNQHFKSKLELFGLEKLGRDIDLDDLNMDDKLALCTGSEQYLGMDQLGRLILFSSSRLRKYNNIENQMRAIWFLTMLRLKENDSFQQKGAVIVKYDILGPLSGEEPARRQVCDQEFVASKKKSITNYIDSIDDDYYVQKSCSLLLTALPIKIKSFHFCCNDSDEVALSSALVATQTLIGRDLRVRFRQHKGNHKHCVEALSTYGIPKEMLPVENDGNISTDLFELYLDQYKEKYHQQTISQQQRSGYDYSRDDTIDEATNNTTSNHTTSRNNITSILPLKSDILLGRGRPYQDFPGNVNLARLIDDHREEYIATAKNEKNKLTNKILRIINKSGGRFLKKSSKVNDADWVEASSDEAIEKIGHGFRTSIKFSIRSKRSSSSRGPQPPLPGRSRSSPPSLSSRRQQEGDYTTRHGDSVKSVGSHTKGTATITSKMAPNEAGNKEEKRIGKRKESAGENSGVSRTRRRASSFSERYVFIGRIQDSSSGSLCIH